MRVSSVSHMKHSFGLDDVLGMASEKKKIK